MPFRLQCRKAFMTYSRADAIEDKQLLFDHLITLNHVVSVIVAKELHQDGGTHYHCVVAFDRKVDIRDERYFDFEGVHPNIQTVRRIKDVLAYVTKGGDYVCLGFDVNVGTSIVQMVQEAADLPSREQALQNIMARGGDRALKLFNQVDNYLAVIQKPSTLYQPLYRFPDNFKTGYYTVQMNLFKAMIDDPTFNGERTTINKSLWLYGPTRLGKTTLARSMGPHWYMQSMWNAACLDENAKYGVLDDIPWENMKFNYKAMLGMQKDVTVTDKYRKKSVYKGGLPVIVLSNELPDFSHNEMAWLNENVSFLGITEEVFE